MDQSITKDAYDKKHQEYADKLQLLEVELSEHREADYEYQTTVSTVISVARRAKDLSENCSDPMQKRAFLNFILQNPNVNAKKLDFTIASPFNLVFDLADVSSGSAGRALSYRTVWVVDILVRTSQNVWQPFRAREDVPLGTSSRELVTQKPPLRGDLC